MGRLIREFCKRGHSRTPDNLTANRTCRKCKHIWNQKHHINDPKYSKNYYLKNRDKILKRSADWQIQKRLTNPYYLFLRSIKCNYHLTEQQYLELLWKSKGRCFNTGCRSISKDRNLCIDHDHKTNQVRGLLCSGCNLSIGYAKDSPKRLRGLAEYLENKEV